MRLRASTQADDARPGRGIGGKPGQGDDGVKVAPSPVAVRLDRENSVFSSPAPPLVSRRARPSRGPAPGNPVTSGNVRGPVAFSKAAIPHLGQGGRIISIGSALGDRVPFPGVTAYAMTKSALLSFTRGLSRELGPLGVTVNLVSPGSTDTEANPADGEGADFQRGLSSVGRYADPREIADAVAFLASPAASMINGTVITVDGGANA